MSFTLDQTASIWGAIATLLAVAFAWFAHVATALESRKRLYRGVSNLLMGIQKEMELIGHWAGDDEKEDGYLPKSRAEYFVEKLTTWGAPFADDLPLRLSSNQELNCLGASGLSSPDH